MSFNRSGYIGRAPGDSSITIARKTYEPTGVQTDFTFSAGYDNGYCDVYLNGVKLVVEKDYTATNGSTVGLNTAANSGDIVEVIAYKAFNLGVPLSDITGDLSISGSVSASSSITADNGFYGDGSNLSNIAGTGVTQYIAANSLTVLGSPGVSTITRLGATDLNVTGIITANGLSGNVTGSAATFTTGSFSGNVTIGGTLTYEDVTNIDALGIITARAGVNVSGGEFKVGTALTIGSAGVATATSFSGPLTGNVTGNLSGDIVGTRTLGTGVTVTAAGVVSATTYYGDGSNLTNITSTTINSNADNRLISGSGTANTLNGESNLTFDGSTLTVTGAQTVTGDLFFDNGDDAGKDLKWDSSVGALTFDDEVYARWGSGADFTIRHVSNNTYLENNAQANAVGNLYIRSFFQENGLVLIPNGAVEAYYDNSKKLETTNDGTVTTGIATATGGHITGGGELKVGTGVTISSTAGVSTFSKAVTFNKADVTFTGDNYDILFDASSNCIRWADNAQAQWGTGQDLRQYHDGSHGNINVLTGDLLFKWNSQETFRVSDTGTNVTGIGTFTEGLSTDGLLREKFNTTAGKLSNNTNIDLADGMVHYFTTQETTTCTPNIRYNSSNSLNNMMHTGEAITVTIITTAATAGYSAQLNIDGAGQTEEWIGGSAPSAGAGSDGHDIYSYSILKTASAQFKVIANVVNATN